MIKLNQIIQNIKSNYLFNLQPMQPAHFNNLATHQNSDNLSTENILCINFFDKSWS